MSKIIDEIKEPKRLEEIKSKPVIKIKSPTVLEPHTRFKTGSKREKASLFAGKQKKKVGVWWQIKGKGKVIRGSAKVRHSVKMTGKSMFGFLKEQTKKSRKKSFKW